MITTIPSDNRHHANFGWLDTRWHFSFDSYYDPQNVQWGALRVFNDDVVSPAGGFPTHGHRDMEIVTYVIDGTLEHQDSLGTREQLHSGEVQVMSAGSGIRHSEYNASSDASVHFLQLWITPRVKGSEPRWAQRGFADKKNRLLPVVSAGSMPDTLTIDQDAVIYLSELEKGKQVAHGSASERKAYLFVIDGAVEVNGRAVAKGDQARIDNEPDLAITATEDAQFMLLDLPK